MKTLITILARKGSQALPGKNTKIINGKPLIMWSVEQALAWGKGSVAISTDIEKMDSITKGKDLTILKRPKDLAQSDTPKLVALRHEIIRAEKKLEQTFDVIIDLDVTNPTRKVEDIESCFQMVKAGKVNTVVSAVMARRNPYFNMVEMLRGRPILCKQPATKAYRRQDVPYAYDLNACIYAYKRNWLLGDNGNSPITENTKLYVMEDWQGFDIDSELDFMIVESIMKAKI